MKMDQGPYEEGGFIRLYKIQEEGKSRITVSKNLLH